MNSQYFSSVVVETKSLQLKCETESELASNIFQEYLQTADALVSFESYTSTNRLLHLVNEALQKYQQVF